MVTGGSRFLEASEARSTSMLQTWAQDRGPANKDPFC
jgi:hypothetical protein